MRVLVRYHDGSLFDGDWFDAPVWGVVTISYFDEQRGFPMIRHQGDYYHLAEDGTVIGVDGVTVRFHMMQAGYEPESGFDVTTWASENNYKIGVYLGDHEYGRIYQLGKGDRDSLR